MQERMLQTKIITNTGRAICKFATDVPSSDNNWGTNFAFDHKPDEKFTLCLKFGDEDYFEKHMDYK